MLKNKQSNLIASVKTPNIGFINKHIIHSGIKGGGGGGGGGGYSVLVLIANHFSQISFH